MKVVGFNFTRISIERLEGSKESKEKVSINTNIDIPEISEVKSDILLNSEEGFIGAKFNYGVNYDPKMAKVILEGKILISLDKNSMKEILDSWKDKKLPSDFKLFLFNVVLKKSTLKALQLEEELNLPLHMPLPSFKKEEKK